MTRLPLATLALVLTGCFQQVHRDKLQAASDTDNTSGDTSDDSTTGPPEPTTGGSTVEPNTGQELTSDTGSISLGEPPVIRDFFADTTIEEAGPLWVDAEVDDAVRTRLVIEREGEEVAAVDDPKLPWELPITSESTFDGAYTVTLQAWASGGAQATANRDVTIDLPEGGTVAASWEDSGDWPSSVAALGVIRADNVAPTDGIIAALAVDGQDGPEMRLYRFDSDLTLKHPVQAWCGGDICRWTPTGLVVDSDNEVWVVGNDDEFSWLMKFDANGQPVWSKAHKLFGGHASGVAVDGAYTYISGWADKSEDMISWSNARIWVVQAGITVGVHDYSSLFFAEGDSRFAKNRGHGIAVRDGRIIIAGETQLSDPEDGTSGLTRGVLLEFLDWKLVHRFTFPGLDTWEESGFNALTSTPSGFVAAGWYVPGLGELGLTHYLSFNTDLDPDGPASFLQAPPGESRGVAIHPEAFVVADTVESWASASSPGLWDERYLAPSPFTRADAVAVDRYGRIFLAGSRIVNGEPRAGVHTIQP